MESESCRLPPKRVVCKTVVYTSAEQDFSALSGYRDAASLSVYCKYAGMYKDRTDYAGGQDELSNITLQYDTSWQQDVDALETRVKGYKAEKDAAEEAERQRIAAENAAKREQSLKDQYSGKLPVEGMPVSCLKYTLLGEPDKRLNCKNFDGADSAESSRPSSRMPSEPPVCSTNC